MGPEDRRIAVFAVIRETIMLLLMTAGIVWPALYYGRNEVTQAALAATQAELAATRGQLQQVATAYNQLVGQIQAAQAPKPQADAAKP
jgi:hypothetical protein